MLEILPGLVVPASEFSWSYARSGGPGGQNVNKVASKAILRWDVMASPSIPPGIKHRFCTRQAGKLTTEGELVLMSERFRDQERNRQDCLDKLRTMLLQAATPPKPRHATKPTLGSKLRRLEAKKRESKRRINRRPGDGD